MAQIAYRVSDIGGLGAVLKQIVSVNPNILEVNPSEEHSLFSFHFLSEPTTYFELAFEEDLVIHSTQSKVSFMWVKMYEKETDQSPIVNRLPYSIDYECTAGEDYAGSTYIGNLSGTLDVLNILYEDNLSDYYIFFDDDYLAIVEYKMGAAARYLVCSCRSEQDGNGGYILSSECLLLRQSDNHILGDFLSGSLLSYYNRFGEYKPGYPIDSIDTNYCSIPYSSLEGYSEIIPIGKDKFASVKYKFTKHWYASCTCSLLFDNSLTNKLPNYNNLVTYVDDSGSPSMSNTLNGISLLLPNYFFIDVAPLSTHEYKYVFDTPEMCYCSMYNMLGGNIVQQSYPTKGNKFMCFPLTTSDEKSRKSGNYMGFAFKLPLRYDDIIDDEDSATVVER